MRARANRTLLLLFACVAALVATALSARLTTKLLYTGDEPRYLLQALSIGLDWVPVMPQAHYESFAAAHKEPGNIAQYQYPDLVPPGLYRPPLSPHPLLFSALLAPVSANWSLTFIRLIPFAMGVAGLCFLAGLLVKQTTSAFSAAAAFVPAVFCFPALPYQFLALPEILLFSLVAIAFWNLSSSSTDKLSGYVPAMVCAGLAPFVHVRGLALFGAVAAVLGFRVVRENWRGNWRPILIFGAACLATLVAAFLANSLVQGAVPGWIKEYPIWKPRPLVELFVHYREGLLPYAPIWVLSFSGLIAALRARKLWAFPALLFLVVFLLGSARSIGESYPGRYWVQAVPVLSLCLSGFTEGAMRPAVKAILYLPLTALSLANTVLFVRDPGLHLGSRSGAISYDVLAKTLSGFDFSFWLDVPDSSVVRLAAICFCALVVTVVALASIHRSTGLELAACLLLLIGFDAHRVTPVPITTTAETNAVIVRLREEIARRPIRLRFQVPWKEVGPRPDESTRPVIEVADGNTRWRMPIMTSSVLVHKGTAPANDFSIALRWIDRDPFRVDPAAPGAEFAALACDSVLARFW